jgi:hypothetical protein
VLIQQRKVKKCVICAMSAAGNFAPKMFAYSREDDITSGKGGPPAQTVTVLNGLD